MKLCEFVGHTFELYFRELLFVVLSCGRALGVCSKWKSTRVGDWVPTFQSANQHRR